MPISCSVLYRPLVGNTKTPVSVPGRLGGPPLGGFYPNSIRISCIFLRTASMNVLRPIPPSINFDILLSAISLLIRQYGDPDFSLRTTRGEPPPGASTIQIQFGSAISFIEWLPRMFSAQCRSHQPRFLARGTNDDYPTRIVNSNSYSRGSRDLVHRGDSSKLLSDLLAFF